MKKYLLAFAIFTVATAQAVEIPVAKLSQYTLYGNARAIPSFEINEELGRAWVNITIFQNNESYDQRVQIEGLSYDNETKSIVIENEGQLIACSELKTVGKSIFKRTGLFMTKSCEFKGKWKEGSYDNGFEIKKTRNYYITLEVK